MRPGIADAGRDCSHAGRCACCLRRQSGRVNILIHLATAVPALKLILLELNELSPELMSRFIDEGELPNFRRLREQSTLYTTDAGEDPPNLEPWIQWITVHTGVPFAQHQVFHLGDAEEKLRFPGIGQLLSEAGANVGICGSMNANYPQLRGYVVPDPWSKRARPHPEWLSGYYDYVATRVQESSRDGSGPTGSAVRFGATLMRAGLSASTVWETVWQVASECVDKGLAWRKAGLLDLYQYDLFRGLNARYQVQFATFFSNCVAHYQHYYWRNMSPELFPSPPLPSDHDSLRGAIKSGFKVNDAIVGRILKDYPDSTVVFCTALSQAPWTDTQKVTYRPHDMQALLSFAGVASDRVSIFPVMAEQFHVKCQDEEHAREVCERLRDVKVDGRSAMFARAEGASVFVGCSVHTLQERGKIATSRATAAGVTFEDLFYMIHTMRSGEHVRPGMLWIRSGRHTVVSERVSIAAVAPTILSAMGVSAPAYMRERALPV
jgi:hypothetical protein